MRALPEKAAVIPPATLPNHMPGMQSIHRIVNFIAVDKETLKA